MSLSTSTMLALGGFTFVATRSFGWAFATLVLGIPLQMTGMAYRPTAFVVAGLGTLLLGGAATGGAAVLIRLLLFPAFPRASWLLGGTIGCLAAALVVHSF